MRKKKNLNSNILLVILVILLVCVSSVAVVLYRLDSKYNQVADETVNSTNEPVETIEIEETKEEHYSTSLFMVGDALLHTTIDYDAMNSDGTYNFTALNRIGEIASQYDLKYYNQETILGGDELGIQGYPTFNGPSAFGDYMVSLGFNLVSLANNHALDQGIQGINNSMQYWNSQEGIVTSGTYTSQEDYENINVHEINNISYAFISYTYGCNGIVPPSGYEYSVAIFDNKQQELLDKVSAAKQMADVVIVAIHWGNEYQTEPSEQQTQLAYALSDAGADIIIGNHPHCIQPIEWINEKTICFYALGNVIAAQSGLSQIEIMACLTINKTIDKEGNITIDIRDVSADLMYCYYDSSYHNFDVIPFTQMDENHLSNYNEVYEQYLPIITQLNDSIKIGLD